MNQQSNLTIEDWKRAQFVVKISDMRLIGRAFQGVLDKIDLDAREKYPNENDSATRKAWVNVHPLVKMYVLRMTELCFTGETIQAVADEMVVAGAIVDTMIMALEQKG